MRTLVFPEAGQLELIARGGLRLERVTVPGERAAEALALPSLKPIVVRGA